MLSNCPKCGQLFNKVTKEICSDCFEEEEQMLKQTQNFLRENRNAGRHMLLMEIEGLTGDLIDKWVDTKRINLVTQEDLAEQEEKANKQKQLLQKLMGKKSGPAPAKEDEEEDKPKRMGMHFKRQ